MLTEKHLNQAAAIDNTLKEKGLTLVLKNDSPLNEIVQYVETPYTRDLPSMESRDLSKEIVKLTMSFEDEGQVAYDAAMDRVVADLAPKLADFIALAKEQVNPLIKKVTKGALNTTEAFGTTDILNGIEVREGDLPDFLLDTSFINLVEEYRDKQFNNNPLPSKPVFPTMEPSAIRTLIANYPVVGTQVSEWLGESDVDYQAYNGVFRQQYQDKQNIGAIFNHDVNALKNSVVIFILSNVFIQDMPQGVLGTLSEYNTTLSILRSQSALGIRNYLDKLERSAKAGILISSRTEKAINVNPILYREWIEKGGDVETIYGLSLRKDPYETIDDINGNKDKLLKTWNDYKEKNLSVNSVMYLNKVKESLLINFVTALSEADKDFGVDNDTAIKTFKELLEHVGSKDLEDIPNLAVKLVCRSKYPQSEVEVFISGINDAANDEHGLNANEGALISLIKYVGLWVSSTISIEKV